MFARGIHDLLGAYANAVFHVEDSTIDGDSIKQGGSEMGVLMKNAFTFRGMLPRGVHQRNSIVLWTK